MMRFFSGNQIELLESGKDFFPALIGAIEGAERDIYLETYIFCDDATGRSVAHALVQAAQRGVAVQLLVDGVGSRAFVDTLLPDLRKAGVRILVYRREKGRFLLRRYRLRRLHRKLALIDGEVAFVGGINIIDDFQSGELSEPRFDFAVKIRGSLLGPIQKNMLRLWWLVSWAGLHRRPPRPRATGTSEPVGDVRAAYVYRDSLRHRHDIENAYLEMIRQAQDEIVIACAYFFPGRRFRKALLMAAQRGVKVTLLLQGVTDHPTMCYAARMFHPKLLENGIRLYEYQRSELHAKVAVIDRRLATVGSSNIDPFSLLLAREANVVIDDAVFAEKLRACVMAAIAQGTEELSREELQRMPLRERCKCWLAYRFVRLSVELTGARRPL